MWRPIAIRRLLVSRGVSHAVGQTGPSRPRPHCVPEYGCSDLQFFSCDAGAKPPPSARPSGRAGWGSSQPARPNWRQMSQQRQWCRYCWRRTGGDECEVPRGQVVRETRSLVITEIGDFRTTPGHSPCAACKSHTAISTEDVAEGSNSGLRQAELGECQEVVRKSPISVMNGGHRRTCERAMPASSRGETESLEPRVPGALHELLVPCCSGEPSCPSHSAVMSTYRPS